jgi:hypothetical protein
MWPLPESQGEGFDFLEVVSRVLIDSVTPVRVEQEG